MFKIFDLTQTAAYQTIHTLVATWPFLLVSVVISVLIKIFLDHKRVAKFLNKYRQGGVWLATAAAVGTPLCSCGTTAVVLGMMASYLPWAPIVAFMTSSPLTSPQELVYSAGLFGWPFALAFFSASILLGLLGGFAAHFSEGRGWLKGQARFSKPAAENEVILSMPDANCSGCEPARPRATWKTILREIYQTGPRLLVYFLGFAFIGYLLNGLIPEEWAYRLFGQGNIYGVPLAATLGLPLYINTEASLPMVRAMLDTGISPGAALAFLITGAGTSVGAIAGALTIARWRVISLVIGTLWVGAIIVGFAYNALLSIGLF